MPTKRQRIPHTWQPPVADGLVQFLETGKLPKDDQFFDVLLLVANEDTLKATWHTHRDQILGEWIRRSPGCRPWAWWRYDSPEPRRRLGGKGEVFAPGKLDFGIELDWIARSVDRDNPPRYESEAAYLSRHGLLTEAEQRRLPADAFAESIIVLQDART